MRVPVWCQAWQLVPELGEVSEVGVCPEMAGKPG